MFVCLFVCLFLAKLNSSSRTQNPANGSSTDDVFPFLFLAVSFGAPVYWHLHLRTYQSLTPHLQHLHRWWLVLLREALLGWQALMSALRISQLATANRDTSTLSFHSRWLELSSRSHFFCLLSIPQHYSMPSEDHKQNV